MGLKHIIFRFATALSDIRAAAVMLVMLWLAVITKAIISGLDAEADAVFNYILLGIFLLMCPGMISLTVKSLKTPRLTFRRSGLVLLHLGIPFIVSGYLAGSFGIDGEMTIRPGETRDFITLKNGDAVQTGFSVRCDGLGMSFNKDGSPSEVSSSLSFIENSRVIKASSLSVNHPVSFSGFAFYQSSYLCDYTAIIKYHDGSNTTMVAARHGNVINPGPETAAEVGHVIPDLMGSGPAVELNIRSGGKITEMMLLKNLGMISEKNPDFIRTHPEMNPSAVEPYTFTLEDVRSDCSTVLSVRKDPGLYITAGGACLLAAGLILSLVSLIYRKRGTDGH